MLTLFAAVVAVAIPLAKPALEVATRQGFDVDLGVAKRKGLDTDLGVETRL